MAEGTNLVHTPTLTLNHSQVEREAAERLLALPDLTGFPTRLGQAEQSRAGMCSFSIEQLGNLSGLALEIRFLTPARLIVNEALCKTPSFDVLFARLLKRLDELEQQFGDGAPRAWEQVQALHELARRVELVEDATRWVEVWSGSTRRGKPSPLSGFVGRARYAAPPDVWQQLLPWLLWGELAQVGKDTVKGNGVMKIKDEGEG